MEVRAQMQEVLHLCIRFPNLASERNARKPSFCGAATTKGRRRLTPSVRGRGKIVDDKNCSRFLSSRYILHRQKTIDGALAETGEASRFKGLSQNENARPALSQAGGSFV